MKIGIFWFYKNTVLGIAHDFDASQSDSLGLIDSEYTHVDYWKYIKAQTPKLQYTEYEEIPRGRVIFDTKNDRAIVYLDKTLLTRSAVDEIFKFFSLSENRAVLRTDPHYKI